jgi:hypothetical protein
LSFYRHSWAKLAGFFSKEVNNKWVDIELIWRCSIKWNNERWVCWIFY